MKSVTSGRYERLIAVQRHSNYYNVECRGTTFQKEMFEIVRKSRR